MKMSVTFGSGIADLSELTEDAPDWFTTKFGAWVNTWLEMTEMN